MWAPWTAALSVRSNGLPCTLPNPPPPPKFKHRLLREECMGKEQRKWKKIWMKIPPTRSSPPMENSQRLGFTPKSQWKKDCIDPKSRWRQPGRSSHSENGCYLPVPSGSNAWGRMQNNSGSVERFWSQKSMDPHSLKNWRDLAHVLINFSKLHFSLSWRKLYSVTS